MNLPSFPEYVTNLKLQLAKCSVQMDKNNELASPSYSILDATIEEHWNYCAGTKLTSRTWLQDNEYFTKYYQGYKNKLIQMLSHRQRDFASKDKPSQQIVDREIAALFLFLYKLDSIRLAVTESNDSNLLTDLDALWAKQPAKSKQSFSYCFKGRKTLHTVQVLDGTGDLIHFINWFNEYCLHRDVSNTTVIISLGPRSSKYLVDEYLYKLEETHPLKNHHDLTICNSTDLHYVLNGAVFAPIVSGKGADSYCAMYTISAPLFLNVNHFLDFPRMGLPTCLVNEMGYETCTMKGLQRIPEELYEYSFGVGNNPRSKPIGFFFAKPQPIEKLEDILPRLSDNLKAKLFGQQAVGLNTAELLVMAQKVQIVCIYYSHGRNLKLLTNLLQNLNNSNVVVFFTGRDELPSRVICPEMPHDTKRLKVTCGNLNKVDYADLMQLIRADSKHFLLSSGDNSFAHSLAIGKIPLYLFRNSTDEAKKNAIRTFLNLIYEIALCANHDVKPFIAEIIQFVTTGSQAKIPSIAALDFFANKISSFIRSHYDFSKNMSDLLINVENNYREDLMLIAEPISKAWQLMQSKVESRPRRAFTPMFIIRHYETAAVVRTAEAKMKLTHG